eukprot:15004082-Ditylum_brightwellii.AAC.1
MNSKSSSKSAYATPWSKVKGTLYGKNLVDLKVGGGITFGCICVKTSTKSLLVWNFSKSELAGSTSLAPILMINCSSSLILSLTNFEKS